MRPWGGRCVQSGLRNSQEKEQSAHNFGTNARRRILLYLGGGSCVSGCWRNFSAEGISMGGGDSDPGGIWFFSLLRDRGRGLDSF